MLFHLVLMMHFCTTVSDVSKAIKIANPQRPLEWGLMFRKVSVLLYMSHGMIFVIIAVAMVKQRAQYC